VWVWGTDWYGSLGLGVPEDTITAPTAIPDLDHVVAIGAGYAVGFAVKADGTVWGWGMSFHSQLGTNSFADKSSPVQIPGVTDAVSVTGSEGGSVFALTHAGTVWAWGDNSFGQLGLGTKSTTNEVSPTLIPGLTDVVQVAIGCVSFGDTGAGYALKADGTVWAWGDNSSGQLGLGDTAERLTPTQIPSLSGVKQIAAGPDFALALLNDGTLYSWGANDVCQLGDNTKMSRATPGAVLIPAGSSVTMVAATNRGAVAILADSGNVIGWGFKSAALDSSVTALSGLTAITSITITYSDLFAITAKGDILVKSNNYYGQLGTGNTNANNGSRVILTVPSVTGVTALAATRGTVYALQG
jgi:alpha-tubulin suppressor-like RCC1 family protein